MGVPVRVLVADDHPLYRDGVARTLIEAGGFDVVAQVDSAEEARDAAAALAPDVALLDISMPGGGVRAAQMIRDVCPEVRVAMLTVSENNEDVRAALNSGARGYILKGVGGQELVRVVREIAGGSAYVSPGLAARMLRPQEREPAKGPEPSGIEDLTKREEDILRMVSGGDSNREIANRLGLQEKTVKHYMTSILQKLSARNRVEAALMAREVWGRAMTGRLGSRPI